MLLALLYAQVAFRLTCPPTQVPKYHHVQVPMPYPSAIFIRDKALVVNVESMRLIICQDEVLVLSVPSAEQPSQPAFPTPDCPFVKDLVQRVSEQKLSFASDHNLHMS